MDSPKHSTVRLLIFQSIDQGHLLYPHKPQPDKGSISLVDYDQPMPLHSLYYWGMEMGDCRLRQGIYDISHHFLSFPFRFPTAAHLAAHCVKHRGSSPIPISEKVWVERRDLCWWFTPVTKEKAVSHPFMFSNSGSLISFLSVCNNLLQHFIWLC